jgi:hypothetical protein
MMEFISTSSEKLWEEGGVLSKWMKAASVGGNTSTSV